MPKPAWAESVKENDWLRVKEEYMTRGGQAGQVMYVHEDGVGLDFFTDIHGETRGSSQEFWEWGELEAP